MPNAFCTDLLADLRLKKCGSIRGRLIPVDAGSIRARTRALRLNEQQGVVPSECILCTLLSQRRGARRRGARIWFYACEFRHVRFNDVTSSSIFILRLPKARSDSLSSLGESLAALLSCSCNRQGSVNAWRCSVFVPPRIYWGCMQTANFVTHEISGAQCGVHSRPFSSEEIPCLAPLQQLECSTSGASSLSQSICCAASSARANGYPAIKLQAGSVEGHAA